MVKASEGALQDLSSKEVQSRTDELLAKDIAGGTAQKKTIKPLQERQMKDAIRVGTNNGQVVTGSAPDLVSESWESS